MSRSIGLAHIIRHDDGTSTGVWGLFTLKSAFQPIFAFRDGRLSIAAFEGLTRSFREKESVAPPAFFRDVPAADRLHVETLTRTLHLLNAARFLDDRSKIFVNFDPSVYSERRLTEAAIRDMRLVLHETGIDPDRVVCEVTEQRSRSELQLSTFVSVLRDRGFRIAVDDFGAESSDMERVTTLKPDIVKFDAHWISRLMETRPGVALLKVMVSQIADRGIETVFEGIEQGRQLELAEQAGADLVQGYALARPRIVPANFTEFQARIPAGEMVDREHICSRENDLSPARRRRVDHSRPFGRRALS
ncbi:EAL domain-containing protein [Aquamicrobium sp. LC103]|uniref:EAL domain-containing protein n=1 Tax=Aquamicrobium sp. LC103 TaxID=1120658 RepID=UPI00063E9CDF|nr:EAL domain-containing protein [Aquamicrobium sp. LC103]TKT80376.1 EAL domain-containing protein [Aquamicrobium sp. LC103]